MRKIVIAKAFVLTIFGLYLAVAIVEPPNAKSDRARNNDSASRTAAPNGNNEARCPSKDASPTGADNSSPAQ
jgi:hypothetical protein